MAHRRHWAIGTRRSPILFVLLLGVCSSTRTYAAPTLTSAISRLSHNGQAFDVALPLSGGSGIECRDVSRGATIVLTFSEPLGSANVAVTAGAANIATDVAVGGTMIAVPLSNIANAQAVTLTVSNITAVGGAAAPDASVNIRFLVGDLNADGAVDKADLTMAAGFNGQAVNGANFRADTNLNGTINSLDSNRVRLRGGVSVAGGAANDTAPTLAKIADQRSLAGRTAITIPVSISDSESPASDLFVSVKSGNAQLLPDSAIAISGSGKDRMITVAPPAGAQGDVSLTVNVSDGLNQTTQVVSLSLKSPSNVYVAIIRPGAGVQSLGSGTATLQLAPDELSASVRYDYSNLVVPATSKKILGFGSEVLFDLGAAPVNPDGSITWTFVPVGSHTTTDIVNAIKAGQTNVNIASGTYPNGEVVGPLLVVTGSTTFTPPPSPPALPGGALTDTDAARLLTQATYGPSEDSINKLKAMGIDAWLEQQFNTPMTSHFNKVMDRVADGDRVDDDNLFTQVWWNSALTAPDQLRQRVAFALSQIMVISQVDGDITGKSQFAASYYDMLAKDAFGNYRKLLEDVTLHPAMGQYLDMRNSRKAAFNAQGQITNIPTENYAREILQLFSIGLYKLHPDGSMMLDQTGLPIPTYDQSVLTGIIITNPTTGAQSYQQHGLAAAFTGWNWHQTGTSTGPPTDYLNPMTPMATSTHETAAKVIFDGIVIPAGQTTQKDMADSLNAIFNHANTGPFICQQLIQRLVGSNPSPAYVYRVAQVFANNGQGVRGDLKAVIKAILTDYEARSTSELQFQGYGKLREPVLRVTHVMRALHVTSNSGLYKLNATDSALGQTPLRAPTVFNFYEPTYSYPGQLTDNGLVAPEFQITSETSAMNYDNFMNSGIGFIGGGGTFQDGDLKLDLSPEIALATNPSALMDRLNRLLTASRMTDATRNRIITYLNGVAAPSDRAKVAVDLIVASPDFVVQK